MMVRKRSLFALILISYITVITPLVFSLPLGSVLIVQYEEQETGWMGTNRSENGHGAELVDDGKKADALFCDTRCHLGEVRYSDWMLQLILSRTLHKR